MKTSKKAGANAYTTQTKSPFIQGPHKTTIGQAHSSGGVGAKVKKSPKVGTQK